MPEALGAIWVRCRQYPVNDTGAAVTAIKMTSDFFLIGGFKIVIKAKYFRTAFKMPIQLLSVEHMLILFSPDMVVYDKCYQIFHCSCSMLLNTKTNGPTERVFPLEDTSCRPPIEYTEIIKCQDKKLEENMSVSES